MKINKRHRRRGTLIWILMSLCVALLLVPQLGGSKRASPSERFLAFDKNGQWYLASERDFDIAYSHSRVCSVYALCWKEPTSPIPLLLPITKSVRCDIDINAMQGTPPDPNEIVAIRALVTQSLQNDILWAGLPTTHGQRVRSFAFVELLTAAVVFACWMFSRWITIWLVASAGVQHFGRGTCGRCGYRLDGLNTATCPECGTPFGDPANPA